MKSKLQKPLITTLCMLFGAHATLIAYSPEYIQHVTHDYLNSYGKLPQQENVTKEEPKQTWMEWLKGPRFKPEVPVREERHYQDFLDIAHPFNRENNNDLATDFQSIKKLEVILGGEKPNEHLAKHLSSFSDEGRTIALCNTRNGQKAFAAILTQPRTSLEEVKKNPAIIKAFVDNERLSKAFGIVTSSMKNVEDAFLEFYAAEIPENEKLFANVYLGKWEALNKSTLALETNIRARNALDALAFLSLPATFWCIASLAHASGENFTERMKLVNDFVDGKITFEQHIKNFNNTTRDFSHTVTPSTFAAFTKHGLYDTWQFTKHIPAYLKTWLYAINLVPDKTGRFLGYAGFAAFITTQSYGMYTTAVRAKFQNDITCFIQNKMIALSTYVTSMKQLYLMATKNPEIVANMPELADLKCLVTPSSKHSASFNKLISMLDTSTLKGKPSFFSLAGRILASYKLMQETKHEFTPILQAAGKLEALWAMACKIKKHAETKHPYTFVTFIESETPYIYAQDFCNPFIPEHLLVANSIEMGSDASGHAILTGPNTGGKSTLIKALWLNTLLAQTFGVAYATQFVMTPFYKLSSYLNINDNVSEGTSLFKAEVMRARELRDTLVSLRKDQFMFIIMDEIFSGTNPEKAQEISFDFIKNVAQFQNCLFINATHFPLLTNLANEGLCKNYCMELIPEQLSNGTQRLKCTYKLLEGISQISNATQIVEEEGISW